MLKGTSEKVFYLLQNTVALWRWLRFVAETCRRIKTEHFAAVGNKLVCILKTFFITDNTMEQRGDAEK